MKSWINRLLNGSTTREGYEYGVAGSPAVPDRTPGGHDRTIEPDSLTVWFENGRWAYVEIAGVLAHNPDVRITRRFDEQRDLPGWAVPYLNAHEENA